MVGSGGFGAADFANCCGCVDDGEGVEADLAKVGDSDVPGADEVDCYFFPWGAEIVTGRK